MNSQDFKTKTFLKTRCNPSTPNYWGIAIDLGYSAVKIFSPNMIASFPSYAIPVEYGTADHSIGKVENTCISYRDENDKEYFVGAIAQSRLRAGEADSSTANLYVRNRYTSPEFKVIARVGLALGMMKNNLGDPSNKTLHVQTGLPPEYLEEDSDMLKSVLAGHHKFKIKLGANEWSTFEFNLLSENIDIMAQPMGTLFSIATDNFGKFIPDANKYFSSNVLIIDPGFGTLDTFELNNNFVLTSKTWQNLGMHRVLQEVSKTVKDKYQQVIPVHAMQKVLGDGVFKTRFDPVKRTQHMVDVNDILAEANERICQEALNTIDGYYNYLQDVNYLVVTGGTGAAWFKFIEDRYKGVEGLKVISGAANDNIPAIFTNVRGYYNAQYASLKKKS